jgi:hypothetical protein
MNEEEDLNDVDGWLLIYVILKYLAAFWGTAMIGVQFYVSTINRRPLSHALDLPLLLMAVGILTSVAAATAVLRTSHWALQLVGLDLLYSAVAQIIAAIALIAIVVGSQQFPLLLRTIVQLAVLCAWFMYFRESRRVHATLGRNLLEEAAEPVELSNPVDFKLDQHRTKS